MHLNSDDKKFTSYSEVNEVVNELFNSRRSKYQENLETSIKAGDFIFDLVQLMYYKRYKVNFKRGGLYIDSPNWIKKRQKQQQIQKMKMINVFSTQQLLH